MNARSKLSSGTSGLIQGGWILVVAFVVLTAALIAMKIQSDTALSALQRQCTELRAQMAARDRSISELKANLSLLRGTAASASNSGKSTTQVIPVTDTEGWDGDLTKKLIELDHRQSNTTFMVERLIQQLPNLDTLQELSQTLESVLNQEEVLAQENAQDIEEARRRTQDLASRLNVPEDVANLDPQKGLENASLQTYWPYFQSKLERDSLEQIALRLRARLQTDRSASSATGSAKRSNP